MVVEVLHDDKGDRPRCQSQRGRGERRSMVVKVLDDNKVTVHAINPKEEEERKESP